MSGPELPGAPHAFLWKSTLRAAHARYEKVRGDLKLTTGMNQPRGPSPSGPAQSAEEDTEHGPHGAVELRARGLICSGGSEEASAEDTVKPLNPATQDHRRMVGAIFT